MKRGKPKNILILIARLDTVAIAKYIRTAIMVPDRIRTLGIRGYYLVKRQNIFFYPDESFHPMLSCVSNVLQLIDGR